MSVTSFLQESPRQPRETEAQRAERLARERVLIEEAREEFRNGLALDPEEFDEWLDRLDHDENAPIPQPRSGPVVPGI